MIPAGGPDRSPGRAAAPRRSRLVALDRPARERQPPEQDQSNHRENREQRDERGVTGLDDNAPQREDPKEQHKSQKGKMPGGVVVVEILAHILGHAPSSSPPSASGLTPAAAPLGPSSRMLSTRCHAGS